MLVTEGVQELTRVRPNILVLAEGERKNRGAARVCALADERDWLIVRGGYSLARRPISSFASRKAESLRAISSAVNGFIMHLGFLTKAEALVHL